MSQFITANGVNATLAAAITTSAGTITLSSTANLPTLQTGQVIPLILRSASSSSVFEIVYGTAISGASITVTRGMEGTSAQSFNVGDYVLCGPTAGTNALIPAVMNPAVSETLPQAYGAVVQPSELSEAITLTLPDAVPAGTSYLIFGDESYAVTVDVSVTSGSPYIALPDGSTVYSWVIPAGTGQGLRVWFDGTNWKAQTFGQTVVAPATQSNAAVQSAQVFLGVPLSSVQQFGVNPSSVGFSDGTVSAIASFNVAIPTNSRSGKFRILGVAYADSTPSSSLSASSYSYDLIVTDTSNNNAALGMPGNSKFLSGTNQVQTEASFFSPYLYEPGANVTLELQLLAGFSGTVTKYYLTAMVMEA